VNVGIMQSVGQKRKAENDIVSLDSDEHQAQKVLLTSSFVILNVRGKKFYTSLDTLRSHDDSYFRNFRSKFALEPEIFIDRPPKHFQRILTYLSCREFVCCDVSSLKELAEIRRELEYYQLTELLISVFERALKIIRAKLKNCEELDVLSNLEDQARAYKLYSKEIVALFDKKKKNLQERVVYVVGGKKFPFRKADFPDEDVYSGQLTSEEDITSNGMMFFDRDPKHFPLILRFFKMKADEDLYEESNKFYLMEYSSAELTDIANEAHFYDMFSLLELCNATKAWKFAPTSIEIRGRKGNNSLINAMYHQVFLGDCCYYESVNEEHIGRMVFDHNENCWKIKDQNSTGSYAKSNRISGGNPFKENFVWEVWEGEEKGYVKDEKTTTVCHFNNPSLGSSAIINILKDGLEGIKSSLDSIWPEGHYGKVTNFATD